MDHRYQALCDWLNQVMDEPPREVSPLAGDASFRRYFRVQGKAAPLVAMDAPPDKEDCRAFVAISRHWHQNGLHVPDLLASDLESGFLLLEDLGDDLYLNKLNDGESPEQLYSDALSALLRIQAQTSPSDYALPPYSDALLHREMELFPDWLLQRKLGMELSSQEQALLQTTFASLRESALAQPTVTVHRDYHSRNLLVTGANNPGIIDYQDAVLGPVTYDLASLLKDCYIEWPREQVLDWVERFRRDSRAQDLHHADTDTFVQWFELMGMQRHLKAAGIFARLDVRDGKPGYLADIPRVLDYLITASHRQPALERFGDWLEDRVIPRLHMLGATSP